MKAVKYIFFLLLIAIIAIAIYIAVQPNAFNVTRTRTIQAPAAVIYDNVSDFKNWEAWSSWVEKDPDMVITIPEQTKGKGGSYSWEDKNGVGTMKTVETKPNESITQVMQVAEFPSSDISWNFKQNTDGSTDVTWAISGKDLPFGFKAYTAFMGSMEEQIGPEYERSLEKLDSIVQADMKKFSVQVDETTTQRSGGYYIYNTAATTLGDFKNKMSTMYPEVIGFAQKNNIQMAGAPYVLYHKWDEDNNAVMFSCCLPTTAKVITTDSNILTGNLEEFKALKVTLTGSYDYLEKAYEAGDKAIKARGLEQDENAALLESYLNTPANTPNPADLKTEIYFPIK